MISAGVEEITFTEASEMLEELLSNDQMLLSYLFNSDSIIGTGNDNADKEVKTNEDAKWIFRKGN